ncbi:hypothetical protein PILCRDRAFT_812596 [Piloderma croceum F 1598]|uniref:Homeobox domain-containing protein n=1 Tax=Piloderma croceum (strain F 1598) TaxID=765440 RepID=A0A0C3GGP9_PILCF|nr:hypothetical protein PILCRDRAFT_812596 [Piloderma croceum F 1598]
MNTTQDKQAKRTWKVRSKLDSTQSKMLADFYESQIYPSRDEMASLANEAGLPYKIVKTWFHNRRQREREREVSNIIDET